MARSCFALQPFQRRNGGLSAGELILDPDEDRVFRRGRAMAKRVDGMAFFKITTGPDGDDWQEVELICTDGAVPPSEAGHS